MRQAARLLPDNPRLLYNLGMSCLEAGRPGEAVPALERARNLDPKFAEAFWRLGDIKARYGAPGPALGDFQQAVALKPSLGGAWYGLGQVLAGLERPGEAAAAFRKARATAGATAIGWLAEAQACELEDDAAGAEKVARRALRGLPGDAQIQELMGRMHVEAGRFDEAAPCFEQVLALDPRRVGAWYQLVRLRTLTAADTELVARMRAAAAQPGLEPAALAMLHLAIGKALDDLGEPGEAMAALDAAQTVRAARTRFDLAAWTRRIDRTIALFTPELIARAAEQGDPDPTPVLILGMPRSGTTLVEQILSSHSQVAGRDELAFWSARHRVVEARGEVEAGSVRQAGEDYLAYLRRLAPTAARVTDKAPFNFLCAGLIHLALPGATIVHCRRRAIDVALSIRQTWFNETLEMPTGGEDLVGYYRAYERLMDHWRRVLPAGRFIEVDYERLVAAPEPEIRRLVAGMGLAWDAACLHPEANDRRVRTASKWQARQPIHAGSVDRWRRYEPWLGALAGLVD